MTLFILRWRGIAFLWHMVRCIMAVLLLVGQELESPDVIQRSGIFMKWRCILSILYWFDIYCTISYNIVWGIFHDIILLYYMCRLPQIARCWSCTCKARLQVQQHIALSLLTNIIYNPCIHCLPMLLPTAAWLQRSRWFCISVVLRT